MRSPDSFLRVGVGDEVVLHGDARPPVVAPGQLEWMGDNTPWTPTSDDLMQIVD